MTTDCSCRWIPLTCSNRVTSQLSYRKRKLTPTTHDNSLLASLDTTLMHKASRNNHQIPAFKPCLSKKTTKWSPKWTIEATINIGKSITSRIHRSFFSIRRDDVADFELRMLLGSPLQGPIISSIVCANPRIPANTPRCSSGLLPSVLKIFSHFISVIYF